MTDTWVPLPLWKDPISISIMQVHQRNCPLHLYLFLVFNVTLSRFFFMYLKILLHFLWEIWVIKVSLIYIYLYEMVPVWGWWLSGEGPLRSLSLGWTWAPLDLKLSLDAIWSKWAAEPFKWSELNVTGKLLQECKKYRHTALSKESGGAGLRSLTLLTSQCMVVPLGYILWTESATTGWWSQHSASIYYKQCVVPNWRLLNPQIGASQVLNRFFSKQEGILRLFSKFCPYKNVSGILALFFKSIALSFWFKCCWFANKNGSSGGKRSSNLVYGVVETFLFSYELENRFLEFLAVKKQVCKYMNPSFHFF